MVSRTPFFFEEEEEEEQEEDTPLTKRSQHGSFDKNQSKSQWYSIIGKNILYSGNRNRNNNKLIAIL